jgi:hypothetical protein
LRTILVGRLLCFLLLAFAVSAQTSSKTGGKPGGGGWQRYELGKGSFSVLLPGKPVEEFSAAVADPGISARTYFYAVKTAEGAYFAQYSLLGASAESWSVTAREMYYNTMWNAMAKGFNDQMVRRKIADRAVLLEKRRAKFSGYDGYELTFTLGEVKGRALLVLVGRHGFAAMTLGTAIMSDKDRGRFFKSFAIKISPAAPAAG